MITEVQITEGAAITRYAQYCPTGQNLAQWLERLVHSVLLAPSNMRRFQPAGTTRIIDRANVTLVTVTKDAS